MIRWVDTIHSAATKCALTRNGHGNKEQEVGWSSNEGSPKTTMLYSLIPCQSTRQSRAAGFGDLRGSSGMGTSLKRNLKDDGKREGKHYANPQLTSSDPLNSNHKISRFEEMMKRNETYLGRWALSSGHTFQPECLGTPHHPSPSVSLITTQRLFRHRWATHGPHLPLLQAMAHIRTGVHPFDT